MVAAPGEMESSLARNAAALCPRGWSATPVLRVSAYLGITALPVPVLALDSALQLRLVDGLHALASPESWFGCTRAFAAVTG